jgi:hypothetical protein
VGIPGRVLGHHADERFPDLGMSARIAEDPGVVSGRVMYGGEGVCAGPLSRDGPTVEDDVGFSGTFVVSRSTASPPDLVDGMDEVQVEQCTGGWLDSLPAPWTVWRVWATSAQLAERTWRDLEVSSKGPIIACEVFDSDGARLDMFSDRPVIG